jgi:predicted dehydrogenase
MPAFKIFNFQNSMFKEGSVIKTGICSFGMSGKLFHAPFIHAHPEYELSAIVERSKNDSRERYPASKLYRSIEELIADDTLELIIVNTPTYTHHQYARQALEAGKHVVVEKPFTMTTAQGEELAALAAKKNVLLSVYQNRRYDGDYFAVKNILQQNLLGEMREVEIRYDRYRPAYGGKPHKEGELPGAGILYDLSPHLVDQALQLFGWPEALFADVWKMRADVVAPDYFEMLLYYDKLRVRLKATCIARESYWAYTLHGMSGSFLQQRSDLQEQQLDAGVVPSIASWCPPLKEPDGILHTIMNNEVIRKQTTSVPGNYMGYFDDVYKALTGKAKNPVPAEDGIKTIKIIEAALQSSAEGRIILLK